jgi:hypothetical protein
MTQDSTDPKPEKPTDIKAEIALLLPQLTKVQQERFHIIHPKGLKSLTKDQLQGAKDYCIRNMIKNKIGII